MTIDIELKANGDIVLTASEMEEMEDMTSEDFFKEFVDTLTDENYMVNGDLYYGNTVPVSDLYVMDESERAYSLIQYTNNSYSNALDDLKLNGTICLVCEDKETTEDIKTDWFGA